MSNFFIKLNICARFDLLSLEFCLCRFSHSCPCTYIATMTQFFGIHFVLSFNSDSQLFLPRYPIYHKSTSLSSQPRNVAIIKISDTPVLGSPDDIFIEISPGVAPTPSSNFSRQPFLLISAPSQPSISATIVSISLRNWSILLTVVFSSAFNQR